MTTEFAHLIGRLELCPGASADALQTLQSDLQLRLPGDYLSFLSHSNGAEGFVGTNYLVIWPVEEVVQLNEASGARQYAPGLLLFGGDGGGEGYGFDTRSSPMPVVKADLVALDEYEPIATSFTDFLRLLYTEP